MITLKARKASILTKVIVLVLIVYSAVTLVSMSAKIKAAEEKQAEIQEEIDALAQENEGIEYLLENSDDPKTIEDIARDELGLVMPGEKIFYGVSY